MQLKNFPYPYYYYGSADSTDEDVIIDLPKGDMPSTQEERKRFIRQLEQEYNLPWNGILAVFEDGVMLDTIYTKAWVDSLNNSLFETYGNHLEKQVYPIPVDRKLPRNKTLAIYKAIRTVMTQLTRTHYRTTVKPVLKGIHDFYFKIKALQKVDLSTIEEFNQRNTADVNCWKIIAFYVAQNHALIHKGIEIYSKQGLIDYAPELHPFIYRQELKVADKAFLQNYLQEWLDLLMDFGSFESKDGWLSCGAERIDMKNEKY